MQQLDLSPMASAGNRLEEFARRGEVIVMAGAGVSAGKPSALPGWKPLNAAIVQTLSQRLEAAIDRPGWLSQFIPVIEENLNTDRFPPDYQAQIIEEMCGDRYFYALQSLDVNAINSGHDGIAVLAAQGALKAVVTTNFDRLIEQALDRRKVDYFVAYDDLGYKRMLESLTTRAGGRIPIIKIHGCVSDHKSMIDTLKQRKRGRSQLLQACLEALYPGYWLYLGFSAADLETDPQYLGLVAGAEKSSGSTYVAYPGNPTLREGAKRLMDAYGDRGQMVVAPIAACLGDLCRAIGAIEPDRIPDNVALGEAEFQKKLQSWTEKLSTAAVGLCLSAILESIGQAEPAVRILDRLVRKELLDERDTPDFRALQLHYGRLGAAWGRFFAVPDMGGYASNASVETAQSLLRILDSESGFAATSWLACLYLWLNRGEEATKLANELIKGLLEDHWGSIKPRTDEEIVDAWLSAAQVYILNSNSDTISIVYGTSGTALDLAKRTGDVVRIARVVAMNALALAETNEDVQAIVQPHDADFSDAARVQDGFALGMLALALGRWLVGSGRIKLAESMDGATVAQKAEELINKAIGYFRNQGMDPWELFAFVQLTKALADLHKFDDAQTCVDSIYKGLDRFPVLASHLYEAVGEVQLMQGHTEEAAKTFQTAVEAAENSGLLWRRESLMRYLRDNEG